MLQEPQLSPYDLQFKLFGFPVRISWWFWALAFVLGYENVRAIDQLYFELGQATGGKFVTPGTFALIIVHALALCLSILIHELGHTYLFRYYGTDSRIVLYQFGGLAIPGSFTDWNAARRPAISAPAQRITIAAAGPIVQLLMGIAAWAFITIFHVQLSMTDWVEDYLPLPEDRQLASLALVQMFFETFVYTSVVWSVLNLLPILPLDGGQIMQEVLRIYRVPNPVNRAALVSMIATGLLALFAFQTQRQGSGLLCLMLLASNYQLYQSTRYGSF